jgi:hypothetical protein
MTNTAGLFGFRKRLRASSKKLHQAAHHGITPAYQGSVQGFIQLLKLFCASLVFWGCQSLLAWTPGTGSPAAVQGLAVDTTVRNDVLSFYNCIYTASENYPADMAWSGTVTASLGVAGTTSAIFKEDVRRRVNFYRALVTLPADITFDASHCSDDQDAALMFSRNNNLNHHPPSSWLSFTLTGSNAASNSNIGWGVYGPGAIDAYIRDDGTGNEPVGHRRWLVYSQAQIMGTGDVPTSINASGTFYCANANWVIGNIKASPLMQFVPWPNSGYVPLPLVPARWSLTYPKADFTNATVTMTQSGTALSTTIISSTLNGYGDNTLVWTPAGMPPVSINADTPCNVMVAGITGSGVPTSYSYTVTLFDPNVLNNSVAITGTGAPYVTGADYALSSISQADSMNLQVSTGSTAAWTEGAEDSPAPQIQTMTTGAYALRQSAWKRTGAKAFQLTFPGFSDQSFLITRSIIPTGASNLVFYESFRFVTTASRLSAEISADNGVTWTEVWGRNGNGSGSSSGWDASFNPHSIPLAAYAGIPVLVRFIFRAGNSAFIGESSSNGVFIDDISISSATQLVNSTNTTLSGTAVSFTLNATTAGAPLTAGTSYYMRIRPSVGLRWYGFGVMKIVTAQPLVSYSNWIASQYPQVTGGVNADYDHDGIPNGLEFAFGFNPAVPNPPSALPQPIISGGVMNVTYTEPSGITGVAYGAQWSLNLVTWNPIPDTGSNGTHVFSVNTAGQTKMFFRHNIIVSP